MDKTVQWLWKIKLKQALYSTSSTIKSFHLKANFKSLFTQECICGIYSFNFKNMNWKNVSTPKQSSAQLGER